MYLQELLRPGQQISTSPTGRREVIRVFAGFENMVQPLPTIGGLLPVAWTKTYNLGQPVSPFVFGSDPLPRVRLYGNPRVEFVMPSGRPPATAIALYHAATGRVEHLPRHRRDMLGERLFDAKPFRAAR